MKQTKATMVSCVEGEAYHGNLKGPTCKGLYIHDRGWSMWPPISAAALCDKDGELTSCVVVPFSLELISAMLSNGRTSAQAGEHA